MAISGVELALLLDLVAFTTPTTIELTSALDFVALSTPASVELTLFVALPAPAAIELAGNELEDVIEDGDCALDCDNVSLELKKVSKKYIRGEMFGAGVAIASGEGVGMAKTVAHIIALMNAKSLKKCMVSEACWKEGSLIGP